MQAASPIVSIKGSPLKGFLPFFWLALACFGGVLLGDLLGFPAWIWLAGMGVCCLVALLLLFLPKSLPLVYMLREWTRSDQRLPGLVLALVFFLGGWRITVAQPEITKTHLAYYNDRGVVQLVGKIVQAPEYQDSSTHLVVEVESLILLAEEFPKKQVENISGRVLLQVVPGSEWAYGYRVRVTGLLQTPFEGADFSYRDYLAREGIFSVIAHPRLDGVEFSQGDPIKNFIFSIGDRGHATLQSLFPSPESDLLAGILLGRDQGISPPIQEAFRRTGTSHIIAISGFNIAILAGLFSGTTTRLFGRRWGALTALVGIMGYALLVGGDASVVRAAIMGSLGVMGGMFGRRQNGLNSLGFAAFVMVLVNPNIPWDIGFQLSLAATLGLVLYAQPLEEWLVQYVQRWLTPEQAQKIIGPVSEFFLFSLVAQVMVLPVAAYHFGEVSWLALAANPLILPMQSLVMVLGGLSMLAGLVLPGLGQALAIISLPFVRFTIQMVSWLALFPGGVVILPDFHMFWLGLFYALLFTLTLAPREQQRRLLGLVTSDLAILLVLIGCVFMVWSRVLTAPDGKLHLYLLDSKGTILIQTPGGQAVLIGGGPRPSQLNQALGQLLPSGSPAIDMVIVGSTSRETINALTGTLKTTPVEEALWGVKPEANQTTMAVYGLLAQKGVPIMPLEAGQMLDTNDGVRIVVLWVGERGAVLWLNYEEFSALLPTGKVERQWLNVPLAPDVVLLPNGVEGKNLSLQVINLWNPSVILLALEEADLPLQGQHPVVDLLEGYPLVTTLGYRWIRITTDGDQIWVRGR